MWELEHGPKGGDELNIIEKGKIYENWILGERHIINKKQYDDIRGFYTFNSDEYKNGFIAIEGELSNPKTIFYQLCSVFFLWCLF